MSELPDFVHSDMFPFEGDLRVKAVHPPVLPEPPRAGEGGVDCGACRAPDEEFLWTNEHWRLWLIPDLACPIALSLATRAHFDSPDLPDELAAELGALLIRIERCIIATGGIGRVHFHKWCDGGAHLHWWILTRPEGALQQRGSFLVLWAQTLPRPPEEDVHRRAAQVVAALSASS